MSHRRSRGRPFGSRGGRGTSRSCPSRSSPTPYALNRRTLIRDALDDTLAYEYDAVGNAVNITDANDHTTAQEWDALNRLVAFVRPLGNTTSYEYDEVGNMASRVDAKGQRTNYTFDALDRLVRVDYPDGTNVTASYDAEGNTVVAEGFGFSRTDTWDLLGRVTAIEFDFGPFNKTVAYTYDAVGNRATMVDGENGTTTYAWDALNRLTSMTAPGNLTWTFAYDASSRRTKLTYPNGMYTNTTHSDADWITLVESRWVNYTLIESFSYAYDDVGNRVNVTYENGTSVRYAYDDVYRLTEENYSWGLAIAYAYDGTGNRLTETRNDVRTNYTYDAEDHLLTRGNTTYEWDANGNLVRKVAWDGNTTYGWDYENRLVNVSLPDETVLAYAYSPWNDRTLESVGGATAYLFYDFGGLMGKFEDLIGVYADDGIRTSGYGHGPLIDEPLAQITESVLYLLHDAIGSTTGDGTSEITGCAHKFPVNDAR